MDQGTPPSPSADAPARFFPGAWWIMGLLVVAVLVAGTLSARHGRQGITLTSTVAECSSQLTTTPLGTPSSPAGPVAAPTPVVVGVGSHASIAVFRRGATWSWCFAGLGVGTGRLPTPRATQGLLGVRDGTSVTPPGVLLLVYRDSATQRVVVTSKWAQSKVIASRDGFDVLSLATPLWLAPTLSHSCAPTIGEIKGYNGAGQVTYRAPLRWSTGQMNVFPVTAC